MTKFWRSKLSASAATALLLSYSSCSKAAPIENAPVAHLPPIIHAVSFGLGEPGKPVARNSSCNSYAAPMVKGPPVQATLADHSWGSVGVSAPSGLLRPPSCVPILAWKPPKVGVQYWTVFEIRRPNAVVLPSVITPLPQIVVGLVQLGLASV